MRGTSVAATARAEQQGDAWTITGVKNPVLFGDSADVFLVSAQLPAGGLGLFVVSAEAVSRHGYRTFDGQRAAQLTLDSVAAQPLGSGGDVTPAVGKALVRYQSALCAEAVGAMDEALRLTTEYLTSRKQFGVPLSNFQTLTQRAADMYVSLELARSMNFYAAMSIADGNVSPVIAARAKLQIARSGTTHRAGGHSAARWHRRHVGVPRRSLRRAADGHRSDPRVGRRSAAHPDRRHRRPTRRCRCSRHAAPFEFVMLASLPWASCCRGWRYVATVRCASWFYPSAD